MKASPLGLAGRLSALLPLLLILGGCGGGSKVHSTAGASGASTSPGTPTSGTPALKAVRCPDALTLPGRGKYAGQVATVFIVGSAPKKSGCRFVTGWMAEWIKAGAPPGGYAVGSYVGIRCDEPLPASQGPLGGKYTQYRGVIHCGHIDESAGDPQGQLDREPAGIWGYYASGNNTGSNRANPPAAGPAIPGSTLSKALAKQLMTYARVQPDSVACPPLARKRGAKITCSVSGKQVNGGTTELRGTAEVTIQDQAGHRAEDSYQLTGPGGAATRGTGYPFDPNTGRVL